MKTQRKISEHSDHTLQEKGNILDQEIAKTAYNETAWSKMINE